MAAEIPLEMTILSAEKSIQSGAPTEIPTITPELRQRNYDAVRDGFLDIDSKGRCNAGGICREAFEELKSRCGDPAAWTAKDMQRPEIHDLVLAYRTFGILRNNEALIPQEKAVLEKLLNRQQAINSEKDSSTRAVATNQARLNKVGRALSEGVNTEEYHISPLTGGRVRSVWGEPGKDMSPELTAAVVRLYDCALRRTDKDRAADRFPEEPVYDSSTPEEADAFLREILQYLERIMLGG